MRGRQFESMVKGQGIDEKRPFVLIVEDDDRMRELMSLLMQGEGYDTFELTDGIEALNYLAASDVYRREVRSPDLIVADINMPDYSGLDILMGMREKRNRPPVILVTGDGDEELHREGTRLGAACLMKKPFDVDRLLEAVEKALFKHSPRTH